MALLYTCVISINFLLRPPFKKSCFYGSCILIHLYRSVRYSFEVQQSLLCRTNHTEIQAPTIFGVWHSSDAVRCSTDCRIPDECQAPRYKPLTRVWSCTYYENFQVLDYNYVYLKSTVVPSWDFFTLYLCMFSAVILHTKPLVLFDVKLQCMLNLLKYL